MTEQRRSKDDLNRELPETVVSPDDIEDVLQKLEGSNIPIADSDERLIEQAGLHLIRQEDVTANAALVSGRWRDARQAHKKELLAIEGAERFEGLQRFFEAVHTLTSLRRLSRIAYLVEKRSA